MGSAVPSRVSLLISILRLNLVTKGLLLFKATDLTGGERGVPMKDDRLRVAHICRALTQRALLGDFPFSTFRPVRRLELSPRSIYGGLSPLARGYNQGVTSFQTLAVLLGIFFTLYRPVVV